MLVMGRRGSSEKGNHDIGWRIGDRAAVEVMVSLWGLAGMARCYGYVISSHGEANTRSSGLYHLRLHDLRARDASSRFLRISLPCRTLSGHVTRRRLVLRLCRSHGFLIRRRGQHGCGWTRWGRDGLQVEQLWIHSHAASPSTIRRRRIRKLFGVFVPWMGCDLRSCCWLGHDRVCSDVV